MKVVIVGASGAIGGMILQYVLKCSDISEVITLTRRPLALHSPNNVPENKLKNVIIHDFGDLEAVQDTTWEAIQDANAIVWAMGTYNLNENVNLKYPLAFQEAFAKRISRNPKDKRGKVKFLLLSGAFVEPDQSRRLYFLWDQRKMKGILQTKTIEFAEAHHEIWEAIIIRPGGILFGGNTVRNKLTELLFGDGLAIRSEELGACVADLVVSGSQTTIVENRELVERGRRCRESVR